LPSSRASTPRAACPLFQPEIEGPGVLALQVDGFRRLEIGGKGGRHLAGKLPPEDRSVELVVVEEAAPVEIGRADARPDAVDVAVLACSIAPRRA
jgi:hypothetical protein